MDEVIWAAGFFDGEGTIYVHTGKRKNSVWATVSIAVRQNDRRPLDRFHQAVGTGKVRGPYSRSASDLSKNPYYRWEVDKRQDVLDTLFKLLPYLSEPKREQIWDNFVKLQVLQDENQIKERGIYVEVQE